MMILGKPFVVQERLNTHDRVDDEEYIVGTVLKRSGVPLSISESHLSDTQSTSMVMVESESLSKSISSKISIDSLSNPIFRIAVALEAG